MSDKTPEDTEKAAREVATRLLKQTAGERVFKNETVMTASAAATLLATRSRCRGPR